MVRRSQKILAVVLIYLTVVTGCTPTQPFFLNEDGDLSHLLTEATTIDYPDVEQPSLPDATQTHEPRTVMNDDPAEFWDLSLERAIKTALDNTKVIRTINQVRQFTQIGQGAASPPESLTINPDFAPTVYDAAIQEAGPNGVETALAAFDAQFSTNLFWERTDRPQNVENSRTAEQIFARNLQRNNANFEAELTKRAANGTQFTERFVTQYDASNRPLRVVASEYFAALEAEVRHPLLRGGGTQVNRIPLLLARTQTDIAIADFEGNIRDMLKEVEHFYWELYFHYRNLDAAKTGYNSALGTWRKVDVMYRTGGEGGNAESLAQARGQVASFRGRVIEAKRDLQKSERNLRMLLGIGAADHRFIRPSDEPSFARVEFEWCDILPEALSRSFEIRRQKWRIKQQELRLIGDRNNLLPQLDAVALSRWLGLGDDLIDDQRNGANFPNFGSTAFDELTEGRFQEWRVALELNVPLGFRRELSAVRARQLELARERTKLEEIELQISHSLDDAIKNLDAYYLLADTAKDQWIAAKQQEKAITKKYETSTVPLDFVLDAQRQAADAERAFVQSLAQYNMAIVEVHYRKGSLLEYNNVTLAEGPWPQKAYWDAEIRARRRDASYYFNYGFSRPDAISRGEQPQAGAETIFGESALSAIGAGNPTPAAGTIIETPMGEGELLPTPTDRPVPSIIVPTDVKRVPKSNPLRNGQGRSALRPGRTSKVSRGSNVQQASFESTDTQGKFAW
ncbi:MAG: TolC family protein [Pirellulaceae bacterium]